MTAPDLRNDAYAICYPENTIEAAKIARVALPLASKLNLPANPINYAVLYQHVSGKNPGLSQEIQSLNKKSEPLSLERVMSLYQTFIHLTDQQAIEQFRKEVLPIIEKTQCSLTVADQESKSYQTELASSTDSLKQSGSADELVHIVAALIDETNRMQQTTQTLNDELLEANGELTRLRTEFQKAHRDSLIDSLTNCPNRRNFDNSIERLTTTANVNNESLSLLMIDIDHFKRINDTFGHLTGDEALKWIALQISNTVRGNDIAARFGGEEFAVLLPGTSMEGAAFVADNISNAIRNKVMPSNNPTQKIGRITVSIGVALYQPQEAPNQFIARTDAALYRAKLSGRNRVCTHS